MPIVWTLDWTQLTWCSFKFGIFIEILCQTRVLKWVGPYQISRVIRWSGCTENKIEQIIRVSGSTEWMGINRTLNFWMLFKSETKSFQNEKLHYPLTRSTVRFNVIKWFRLTFEYAFCVSYLKFPKIECSIYSHPFDMIGESAAKRAEKTNGVQNNSFVINDWKSSE